MYQPLNWVEISAKNLAHNIRGFKRLIGSKRVLCPAVKANAYGHGLRECAPIIVKAGADFLAVNALFEAQQLRIAGIRAPIYILGYTPLEQLEGVLEYDCHQVVYNKETVRKLGKLTEKRKKTANLHLKIETGNNRQGIQIEKLADFVEEIRKFPKLKIMGVSTHFANIEDTTEHSYADYQLENFKKAISVLEKQKVKVSYQHCGNTAATILFPKTYFNFVRTGIGNYGLWPSNETLVSAIKMHKEKSVTLKPILKWKTRIAQIKWLKAGEYIGYGCSYRVTHKTRLGILPVGYYDGYDRRLSNTAFVLVHGKRAPVRGRVCMNIIMVDLTDIPEAKLEDEVVLLGKNGKDEVSAELMASWIGTINYEVTTRINEILPRVVV